MSGVASKFSTTIIDGALRFCDGMIQVAPLDKELLIGAKGKKTTTSPLSIVAK